MLLNKIFARFLLTAAVVLALSASVFASGNGEIAAVEGTSPITISDAEALIGQPNVYLIDVNMDEVRKEVGVIHGAILASMDNLEEKLPQDKSATIIFYCINRLCSASSQHALKAQSKGYDKVYVMLEGVEGWVLSGRPVEKVGASRWLNATDTETFVDSIHSRLIFGDLPACRDCHGSNGIKTETAGTKVLINANCASCHKKAKLAYDDSVHSATTGVNLEGAKLFDNSDKKKDEKEKPDCWTCHKVHKPEFYADCNRKQASEKACGSCHEKEQKFYRDTFHGKALFLSSQDYSPTLPACYECHTSHAIYKMDNVKSSLYGEARIETCEKCHEGSHQNFVGFLGHPDPMNKDKNAVLYYVSVFFIVLIAAVFIFFAIHTILWWLRVFVMKLKNPEAWKKAMDEAHHDKVAVRRFNLLNRIQHFFMGVSFLLLSLTGLPQMCYSAGWAKTLTSIFGGPIMLTQIHHIAAVILFLVFVSHVVEVSMVSWKNRDGIRNKTTGKLEMKLFWKAFFGPDSLFPRWQDFKDVFAHMKWFLYMGPRPQFDRWTYWEKFDYLAEIWGMFTFGITGLILWFPTTFTAFLPGWVINLSTIIHSYEALLAIGFIFAVHFFNTHFRVDRFPMDMVIFSGTITKGEMLQERKKWYDRLEKTGELAKLSEQNGTFDKYVLVTKIIGFLMLGLGLLFLFLMVYAFIA